MFLFESELQLTVKKTNAFCCFSFRNKTSPSDSTSIEESTSPPPSTAVGIIDLSKITEITEKASDDDEGKDHSLLQLDEYAFDIMYQPVHDWSTRLASIQKYYHPGQNHHSILVREKKKWSVSYNCILISFIYVYINSNGTTFMSKCPRVNTTLSNASSVYLLRQAICVYSNHPNMHLTRRSTFVYHVTTSIFTVEKNVASISHDYLLRGLHAFLMTAQ